jgi:hypothetical protein
LGQAGTEIFLQMGLDRANQIEAFQQFCGIAHKCSPTPLKNGCRTFPSVDFARYLISAGGDGSPESAA